MAGSGRRNWKGLRSPASFHFLLNIGSCNRGRPLSTHRDQLTATTSESAGCRKTLQSPRGGDAGLRLYLCCSKWPATSFHSEAPHRRNPARAMVLGLIWYLSTCSVGARLGPPCGNKLSVGIQDQLSQLPDKLSPPVTPGSLTGSLSQSLILANRGKQSYIKNAEGARRKLDAGTTGRTEKSSL